MFSNTELGTIASWAIAGKVIMKRYSGSDLFNQDECAREYMLMDSILREANHMIKKYVPMDADNIGYYLGMCEERAYFLGKQCAEGNLATEDFAHEMYVVGYLQRSLELGLITQEDMSIFEQWEEQGYPT